MAVSLFAEFERAAADFGAAAEEDTKLAAVRFLFDSGERAAAEAEVEAGAALALASGAVRALFVRAERASVAAEAARLRASLPLEAAARAFFKRSFVFRAERAAKRHLVCSARRHAAAEREVNAELALSSVRGLFAKRVTFAAEPAPLRSPRALAAAKRKFAERASAVRAERAAEEERRLVSVARRFFSHCSKLLAKNPNATVVAVSSPFPYLCVFFFARSVLRENAGREVVYFRFAFGVEKRERD